jgi:hypothetical protein
LDGEDDGMAGKRRRWQCTVQGVEWECQHTSATSPQGSWLSGGAHPELEMPPRGHLTRSL